MLSPHHWLMNVFDGNRQLKNDDHHNMLLLNSCQLVAHFIIFRGRVGGFVG
jgi:hypothetical protein